MASDILYLFGDQSLDLLPSIRLLSRQARHNSALKDFMRSSTDEIQRATLIIPAHIRPSVSSFDSPLQLVEALKDTSESTPLVSALLAITQLGSFILHLSSNPCALDGTQTLPSFLGLCTGSLSAAAIAASRNLTELLQIAPQIVSLAFHVGAEALQRSRCIDGSSESWTTVVTDIEFSDLESTINDFNKNLTDRVHQKVYISEVDESSVTISGPPTTTKKFFTSYYEFKRARKLHLPIKAAFHATHLIPIHYSQIFNRVDQRLFKRQLHHPIVSTCADNRSTASSLEAALHHITDRILQQPISWPYITQRLRKLLKPTAKAVRVGPFADIAALSNWPIESGLDLDDHYDIPIARKREGSGGVAIVGMSIRSPGSETLEDFWNVLADGRDLHETIPADRFDINTYCDPSGRKKNATSTPYGVFIDRPGYFDPRFFNMSPREAYQTDPQQRLMLLTTYEALENAGYSPNRTPSSQTHRIASFIGQTGDDYRHFNANQNVDTHFVTGNIRAFGPGRINYHFGWEGSSFSIDTACSSSGASIQLACASLLSRKCDMAISGGANILTCPDLFAGLSRGGFLSKTGGCKTFDQDADGYVRGESCGVVVLKRLEDAVADRDNVMAVIRGATTTHSAEAVSITHPHEKTQERLFRTVLNEAGVLPCEVDLVEMHGTGTQAGDTVESQAVTNVLCEGRSPEHPLILTTVKPNVGHGEAASGITSIIKCVLMLQNNTVPPHIGIKGLINNKLPPFEALHARVCSKKTVFHPRKDGDCKRRILVNNFDAAGGNTSMLLEDAPPSISVETDPRSHKIVAFSAKSSSALANNISDVLGWLKSSPNIRLEDLAYTSTARRMHHPIRKAFSVSSLKELSESLEKATSGDSVGQAPTHPTVIFCFGGQGSQNISVASMMYKTHPFFRERINEYARICESYGFPSFLPITESLHTAPESLIQNQLTIVAIELASAFLWNSWGVQASAVIGHSLGEYAALCYAGVLSIHDCLYSVGKRAELIVQNCMPDTHAMLAINAPLEIVEGLLEKTSSTKIEFICFNSSRSVIVGGPKTQIEGLSFEFENEGIITKTMSTAYAFHSSQMDAVLGSFEDILRGIDHAKHNIPVASTLFGETITTDGSFSSDYLKLHTRGPIRFQDAIESLYTASIANEKTIWIDMSPTPTCVGMIKVIRPNVRVTSSSLQHCPSAWQVLGSSVALAYNNGLNINWPEFHRPFENSLQLISLPNYRFDLRNYWLYKDDKSPLQAPGQPSQHLIKPDQSPPFRPSKSLHRIEADESDAETIRIRFATDLSESVLSKAIHGHRINGLALCSSSIYADMAFTAARHVFNAYTTCDYNFVDITDMTITKPFVIHPDDTDQVIYVTATKLRAKRNMQLRFFSRNGSMYQDYATCNASLHSMDQSTFEWMKSASLIRDRIKNLYQASTEGRVHRILKPMVYKLFGNFIDYDPEYRGLEQVILNTDLLEATAEVRFCANNNDDFTCNPYWVDSIAHLSGFVLNGSEFTPDDSIFISQGWRTLRINESLSAYKQYQSYVRIQPTTSRKTLAGDVYLFDGDTIVAICQGLKFNQIQRIVLNKILSMSKTHTSTSEITNLKDHCLPFSKNSYSQPSKPKPEGSTPLDNEHMGLNFDNVAQIITDTLGTDISELDEETHFVQLGMDSLAVMDIVRKLSDQLGSRISASTFIECHSIKELKAHFRKTKQNHATDLDALSGHSLSGTVKVPIAKVNGEHHDIGFHQVTQTLARELDIDMSELRDDVLFTDLGVDSLFTINILPRLNDLVGMQIPTSIFLHNHSVADLRLHLLERQQVGSTTPSTNDSLHLDHKNMKQPTLAAGDDESEERSLIKSNVAAEELRKVIAEETGVKASEIDDDTSLAELGVDSMMSCAILARVNGQTGMDLATNLLLKDQTFSAIKHTLAGVHPPNPPMNSTEETPLPSPTPAPSSLCMLPATNHATKVADTRNWSASSVPLQGFSSSSKGVCV